MTSNHRIITDGGDWMRDVERRVGRQERRPPAVNVHDVFGPGITQRARQIADWNDPETLRNGWYYSEEFSINSPDPDNKWIGMTVVTFDGHGYQELWSHGELRPRKFTREFHWHAGDLLPTFTAWNGEGSWQNYTPALYSLTLGSGGVVTGKFTRIGETIHFESRVALGSGFAFTSNSIIGTPTNTAPLTLYSPHLTCTFIDSGPGYAYSGWALLWSTGVSCYWTSTNGRHEGITTTQPFTWGTGDEIHVSGTYRAPST